MQTSTLTATPSIDKKATSPTQRFSTRDSPKAISAIHKAEYVQILPELLTLDNCDRFSQAKMKNHSIAISGSGMAISASLMVSPSETKKWASLHTHVQAILSFVVT